MCTHAASGPDLLLLFGFAVKQEQALICFQGQSPFLGLLIKSLKCKPPTKIPGDLLNVFLVLGELCPLLAGGR